jgi:hypothetical protein
MTTKNDATARTRALLDIGLYDLIFVINLFYRLSGRPIMEAEKLEKTLDYYLKVSSLPTRPLTITNRISSSVGKFTLRLQNNQNRKHSR